MNDGNKWELEKQARISWRHLHVSTLSYMKLSSQTFPALLPAGCAVTLRSTTKTTPSSSSKSWKPTTSLTRRTGTTSQTQVGPRPPPLHPLHLLWCRSLEWFLPVWRFPLSQGLYRQPDGKGSSQAFYVRAGAQTPLVRCTGANWHMQKQTSCVTCVSVCVCVCVCVSGSPEIQRSAKTSMSQWAGRSERTLPRANGG